MKPEDLKTPFPWKLRRVLIEDRIFYIPSRCDTYSDFTFPGWNHSDLFGNDNPIKIEYCSGNGHWVVDRAAADPNINWIGVEKKFMRVRKIWSKIKNLKLDNLVIICGEAHLATKLFIPSGSFTAAYMNFPDPWPKRRHAKNRLMRPEFIQELWRALDSEASFTVVTDDADYSQRMIAEMGKFESFASAFGSPFYITDILEYGTSYFDQLWREKGKTIRFHQFNKISIP